MFDDIEKEKQKFYCCKSHNFLEDVDIDNVLLSGKISSDQKCYKYSVGLRYGSFLKST